MSSYPEVNRLAQRLANIDPIAHSDPIAGAIRWYQWSLDNAYWREKWPAHIDREVERAVALISYELIATS